MVTPTKNPWETPEGKKIWKSEKEYFGWLRGAIRRIWSDNPLRKSWKTNQLRPLTKEELESKKYHAQTKKVGQCFYCNEWFPGSKLECDHKVSSDGCKTKEEAEKFLWYCAGQTGDSWVLACKDCHKTKTLADRQSISFEEALIEKQTIAIIKSKKDKQWLEERGIIAQKNAKQRRQQIRSYLENNSN